MDKDTEIAVILNRIETLQDYEKNIQKAEKSLKIKDTMVTVGATSLILLSVFLKVPVLLLLAIPLVLLYVYLRGKREIKNPIQEKMKIKEELNDLRVELQKLTF